MKNKNKNLITSRLFTTLVNKHANGDKHKFAQLIGVKYTWLTQKCSGEDGLPSEKLFSILQSLGYHRLEDIDFDFNVEPLRINMLLKINRDPDRKIKKKKPNE